MTDPTPTNSPWGMRCPNPLLGVLNLIDRTVAWPLQLDGKAIRVLHLHAGRMLTQARRIVADLPAHKLDLPYQSMPGLTHDLVLMQRIAEGAQYAREVRSIRHMWPRQPSDPRLAEALRSTLTAGLAWRAAEQGSTAAAASTLLWYSTEWDEMLLHAARWGMAAARGVEPDSHDIRTLLSATGWYSPGFKIDVPSTWYWSKPRLDDAGRADILQIRLPGVDRDDPTIYVVNGIVMGWSQLCEAMTSGTLLPRALAVEG